MIAIQDIYETVWQDTPFHKIILILLGVAALVEIVLFLRFHFLIVKQQGLWSKVNKLEKELKKSNLEKQLRLGDSHWYRKHFLGQRVGNDFIFTLENKHYILLKYPTILARSVPKSPLRFLPGILIAIGVIGTFYGIQDGLQAIPTDGISEDSNALLNASTELLAGMKTAFSTSLMGLVGSSVLGLFLALTEFLDRFHIHLLRSKLDKIAFIETPGHFLSRLNLDSSSQAAKSIGQVAESLSQLVQNQSNLTSEAIGQEVGKAMSPVFTEIRDELTALKEIKAENGAETIERLIAEQQEKLIKPIINELKNSAELTKEASKVVRSLKDELGEVTQSLAKSVVTIQNFQKETLGELKDFATSLQGILSDFRTDTQDVMKQVATEIKTAVTESVEAMESQTDTIKAAGQEASQLMDTARKSLTATLTNIDGMLQQTRITVQEELEQFRLNYQAALQEFFTSQNQLLEESLGEQRQGLATVVEDLNKAFTEEYQRRQTLNDQVEVSLEKVVGTVENVSKFANAIGLTSGERLEQIKEISRTVGDEARQIEQAYSNLIERLNESLETSNQHLVKHLEAASVSEQKFFEQADDATTKISNRLLQAANYLVSAESHNRNTAGV